MPLYGVYLIPAADHPIYQVGSSFLGYDIWTQARTTPRLSEVFGEDTIRSWIGKAEVFSFHITIADCLSYRVEEGAEIDARLRWIASRMAPFTLTNGRFFTNFHGAPTALTLTFDSPDGALQQLHRLVVTLISVLHGRSPYFEHLEETLDDPLRRNLIRYGAPWVLDHFWPHWSLATSVPDQKSWDQLRDATLIHTGLFETAETRTLPVEALQLVELQENGFYRVVESYALTGA
jgi:hypothetical protein